MTAVSVHLVVLLPALAALAGLWLRWSRPIAGLVATGTATLVLIFSLLALVLTDDRVQTISTFGPLAAGELDVPLNLLADRTSAVIALAVAVVGLAVQVFSIWYLHDDRRYPVFASTVSLFLAGMLLVVQSGDLVLTLVGWEVMGWCSYLLIGHVSTRESARRAAHKAFLVTRVADIGFILGLVILAGGARSTGLGAVLAHWAGEQPGSLSALVTTSPVLTLALIGIVIGVAGKSGLVPFHDWLPDAMEGPTPASALIHAATMVAAGTYVIARFHPVYAVDATSRTVLGVLAALTMVYAAVLALAQSDIKRMLAYSTLSQVAIMLSALAFAGTSSVSAVGAGLGHLFSHAIFKSLLFLAIGWLSVLGGGTAFVALRGRARGRGALQWSIGLGLAALAGVPPLVGFFSKEGVLAVAEEQLGGPDATTATVVLVGLVVTVALTAAYSARAWLLLTTESEAEDVALARAEAEGGQAESPDAAASAGDDLATAAPTPRRISAAAAITVSALAVLTVVGTFFLPALPGGIHLGVVLAIMSVVVVVLTALAVRSAAADGGDPAARLGARWQQRSDRGFGVDTAYAAVGRGVVSVARVVVTLDRDVVDAYPRGAGAVAGLLGRVGERAHRGVPSTGLVALVVGVVALAVAGVTVWL
ncbi:NADH-quinone oxidoreductase subunit L [Lapillicoccus sp.]|uniref:NADH-quinone oxidoreductase subunit 5 family protein n=1 Tax=Lapillicoccus sp. TaxID=1909287 RepID=UPI0039832638